MKKYIIFLLMIIVCVTISCKKNHTHIFNDGLCECGEKDPNYNIHTHNFVNGMCICGESDYLVLSLSYYKTYYAVTAYDSSQAIEFLNIPEKYNDLPVSCIAEYAFYSNISLKGIDIPNSVNQICEGAFSFCEVLESIVIPENVNSIETKTFYKCANLQNVIIPNGVTKIGREAFYGCEKLENIFIPKSVLEIEEYAFYDCHNLKIYCESESMPAGWSEEWEHNNEVIWNYVK